MPRLKRIASPIAAILFAAATAACERPVAAPRDADDPAKRGAALITQAGCGLCHRIPHIKDATGNIGPPLNGIAGRVFIAGVLNNTPENMVLWLRSPQQVVPGNAMPDMGLDERQARDIAAYLETLR